MDVEYPCNLDQSDVIDVPELVPKSIDVATDTRMCRTFPTPPSQLTLDCSVSYHSRQIWTADWACIRWSIQLDPADVQGRLGSRRTSQEV